MFFGLGGTGSASTAATASLTLDLVDDTIKVALLNVTTDNSGGFNSAHNYLDDVVRYSGTTDQTLASKTITSGSFNAAAASFTSVAVDGSKQVQALVLYKDVLGQTANSPLIAYIDGFTSVLPNGGNITVTWDSGANKIFRI